MDSPILWAILLIVIALGFWLFLKSKSGQPPAHDLSMLPERFVVFDLETTGLHADRHEIIEIGAILVNRDETEHETFATLVKPRKRVPPRITELTGISTDMIDQDGLPLHEALPLFFEFVGDLPLVAFNAEFDEAFLRAACAATEIEPFRNEVYCALKLARRAWPGRQSYKLADLARDGNLTTADNHRALADCHRAMIVYGAAARRVGSHR